MVEILKKRPGEKLLQIDVDIKDDRIEHISITGDFFAFPETCISDLENQLKGTCKDQWKNIIDETFRRSRIAGISQGTITECLQEAYQKS